jgi:hypothetical protein
MALYTGFYLDYFLLYQLLELDHYTKEEVGNTFLLLADIG